MKKYSQLWTVGLGEEMSRLIENLSMLIGAGMDLVSALDALQSENRSYRMRTMIADIILHVEEGGAFWQALDSTRLLPEYTVALIRVGEETGCLSENLKVVVLQQQKESKFRSKIMSIMMYPAFIVTIAAVIGLGISWFILPQLANVFMRLRIELPLVTQIFIAIGNFLGAYGHIAVPAILAGLVLTMLILFVIPATKFMGQWIMFRVPGIKKLILEIEMSRMGFTLGTLLDAGIPIVQVLDSLKRATSFYNYRKFYSYLRDQVEDGKSMLEVFHDYKRVNKLVPVPAQKMLVSGEQSSLLAETALKVGEVYESKIDVTMKNVTTAMEPMLLITIWAGVSTLAIAIIMPVYGILGGINKGQEYLKNPTVVEKTEAEIIAELPSFRNETHLMAQDASHAPTSMVLGSSTEGLVFFGPSSYVPSLDGVKIDFTQ